MATLYRNRQVAYLSAILFFYFAHLGCVLPFLSDQSRRLGFSLHDSSLLDLICSLISVLVVSVTGLLAGGPRYKGFLVSFAVAGALSFIAIAFLPPFRTRHYQPTIDFDCDNGLRIDRCLSWSSCTEAFHSSDNLTTVALSGCRYECDNVSRHAPTTAPIHLCLHGLQGTTCVVFDDDSRGQATEVASHLQSWPWTQEGESCLFRPVIPLSYGGGSYSNVSCRRSFDGCSVQCHAEVQPAAVASSCAESVGHPATTFWGYVALRSLADSSILVVICLLDTKTLRASSDIASSYGRTRAWASVGVAALAPLSGALLDHFQDMSGQADFGPSAFLAAGCALVVCALVIVLPMQEKRTLSKHHSDRERPPVRWWELLSLFLVVVVLGCQWGLSFAHLPLLAVRMQPSHLQGGLAYTAAFLLAAPFLLILKNLLRTIGGANLLALSLLFHFTAWAGLPFASDAWWLLPFSAMSGMSLCVMWASATCYLGAMMQGHRWATAAQYALTLTHFAIGRGVGSFLGSDLIDRYSVQWTFCGSGVFCACFSAVYLLLYHCCLRKKRRVTSVSQNQQWLPLKSSNGFVKAGQAPIVMATDEFVDEEDQKPSSNNNH